MSVRPATAGISGLSLPGGKMPAGAPAPTRRPIRLRPWAMICRRLAMYWSGLWILTVIKHSFLVQPMAIFAFEFQLLHFTLNLSPRRTRTCRWVSLMLYLLRITFLLGAQIERKISLANEDIRPKGSAALH
uniref:Uncharacterized protein n=2 Tax=mine drainage metagenome TaxID=410659 RepID=E6PP66_9ZZZZ